MSVLPGRRWSNSPGRIPPLQIEILPGTCRPLTNESPKMRCFGTFSCWGWCDWWGEEGLRRDCSRTWWGMNRGDRTCLCLRKLFYSIFVNWETIWQCYWRSRDRGWSETINFNNGKRIWLHLAEWKCISHSTWHRCIFWQDLVPQVLLTPYIHD